jgi:ectoine hydrolase
MKNHPFTRDEFTNRISKVKERKQQRGFDVLVITEPSNMFYLTGYDAWSFYTPQALLLGLDAEDPIWIGRGMDAPSARRTTYLPDENIHPYPDGYVQAPDKHPMQVVAQIAESKGWGNATIGVELDAYYHTPRAQDALAGALPNARFLDSEQLVNWVRIVKSDGELAYMRQAGQITERMMSRAVETIGVGVRECDVAAAIYHAQITGTEDFGGIYSTSQPHICVGDRASEPHATWSDEPLPLNTPINLEFAGSRFHYHGPMSRTVFLGDPPPAYRKLADGVVEGLNAALEAVKPGTTCEQVEATWRRTIAKHGIETESRIGYSIGIGYPPTWGERTASLRPGDLTILQPNMAFHMMTGVWQQTTGVAITQSFYVTETGYHPLTATPRELIVKAR